MSRRFRYVLTAAAAIVIVSAAFGIYAYATAPRAQIVGFADRATGGLRIGEVCEVETSGFPEGATLTYTYTYSRNKKKSPVYGDLKIFSSYSNTGSSWIDVKDNVPYSKKNYKYFAINSSNNMNYFNLIVPQGAVIGRFISTIHGEKQTVIYCITDFRYNKI